MCLAATIHGDNVTALQCAEINPWIQRGELGNRHRKGIQYMIQAGAFRKPVVDGFNKAAGLRESSGALGDVKANAMPVRAGTRGRYRAISRLMSQRNGRLHMPGSSLLKGRCSSDRSLLRLCSTGIAGHQKECDP